MCCILLFCAKSSRGHNDIGCSFRNILRVMACLIDDRPWESFSCEVGVTCKFLVISIGSPSLGANRELPCSFPSQLGTNSVMSTQGWSGYILLHLVLTWLGVMVSNWNTENHNNNIVTNHKKKHLSFPHQNQDARLQISLTEYFI